MHYTSRSRRRASEPTWDASDVNRTKSAKVAQQETRESF